MNKPPPPTPLHAAPSVVTEIPRCFLCGGATRDTHDTPAGPMPSHDACLAELLADPVAGQAKINARIQKEMDARFPMSEQALPPSIRDLFRPIVEDLQRKHAREDEDRKERAIRDAEDRRDFFAREALGALLPQSVGLTDGALAVVAQDAYRVADAMLAARSRVTPLELELEALRDAAARAKARRTPTEPLPPTLGESIDLTRSTGELPSSPDASVDALDDENETEG